MQRKFVTSFQVLALDMYGFKGKEIYFFKFKNTYGKKGVSNLPHLGGWRDFGEGVASGHGLGNEKLNWTASNEHFHVAFFWMK